MAAVLSVFALFELGLAVIRARDPVITAPCRFEDAQRDPRNANPDVLRPGARFHRGESEMR